MTDVLDTISVQVDRLLSILLQPAQFIQDPSKRIFWIYALMSVLIASLVYAYRHRTGWWKQLHRNVLSLRLWLHPSSLLDMKLMVVKSVARTVFFASWILSSYGIAVWIVHFATDRYGPTNITAMSDWLITLVYTIVLFVCSDFSRYFVHRLCHQVPLLWQFHQVHHSAEVMTPLTLYRSHPVENFIFMLRGIVVTGFITGVFFYLFGTKAVQIQILGVNALGLLFNLLGANLRHSHVWISYGSRVEHVLLSPAQHQIHHSDHPRHHGMNYGSCLAIWDWLGGSLHVALGQNDLTFGVSEDELNHDPRTLRSALIGPFQGCGKLMTKAFRRHRANPAIESDGQTSKLT